jgi:hypothetical protein
MLENGSNIWFGRQFLFGQIKLNTQFTLLIYITTTIIRPINHNNKVFTNMKKFNNVKLKV